MQLLINTFIFLSIFISFHSKAKSSCDAVFFEQSKMKISRDLKRWVHVASPKDLSEKFNFSLSVIERILKHEPKTYIEMAKVFLGHKSKYRAKDMMAVDLYRGMVLHPKDYDPAFSHNYFGGNTQHGKSWFSLDSSTARSYAIPSREYIMDNKPKGKNLVPMGIRINIQLPKYIVEEAKVGSFRNETNLALDREGLPNESLFISAVNVILVDYRNKDFKEKDMTYEEFLEKYLKSSDYKSHFVF